MVLAHPSLKPWIRAANTWMEAQKPSQQSMSNIYTSIILSQYWNLLSMMISIWWFHLVQEVLEQLWHQLQKVAVLSTHAYVSRKIVGLLSGVPVLWFFPMIGFHQGVWRCIAGHVCFSHHQRKPASGWFCQSWFQLIVTKCVFEHSSVPAPRWVFVAQLFGPPGGAIEAV